MISPGTSQEILQRFHLEISPKFFGNTGKFSEDYFKKFYYKSSTEYSSSAPGILLKILLMIHPQVKPKYALERRLRTSSDIVYLLIKSTKISNSSEDSFKNSFDDF